MSLGFVRGGGSGVGVGSGRGICKGALQRGYRVRIRHAITRSVGPCVEMRGCRAGSGRSSGAVGAEVLQIALCMSVVSRAWWDAKAGCSLICEGE